MSPTRLVVPITLAAVLCSFVRPPSSFSQSSNSILVVNLNDSGPDSLRSAINVANGDGMPSVITFAPNLSGGTITLVSPLGLSQDGTTIDGDVNGDGDADIELNGSDVVSDGLFVSSSNNVIRSLAINRFRNDGINITGHNNRVERCHLGTDLTGTLNLGNGSSGVRVSNGASGNQIGPGNIIAYNSRRSAPDGGVAVLDGAKNAYPFFIGLTPDYTGVFSKLDFPPTRGAFTSSDGITPIDYNGHPFADNFGARFTATLAVSSAGMYTFEILHPDDRVRVVVDGVVIMEVSCCVPSYAVETSLTSAHALEVDYFDGPGSAGFELRITGPGSVTFSTGGQPGLYGQFFQLRIPSERNRITRNSIFSNGQLGIKQLGIELDGLENQFGVNIQDPGDGDVGPNTALNFPVISTAMATPGQLVVRGFIDTPNPQSITLEFFANPVPDPGGDPSGHGEGKIFLGTARPNVQGNFTATLPPVVAGTLITATATDANGNTSEFAANMAATFPPN